MWVAYLVNQTILAQVDTYTLHIIVTSAIAAGWPRLRP